MDNIDTDMSDEEISRIYKLHTLEMLKNSSQPSSNDMIITMLMEQNKRLLDLVETLALNK